ncbi:MAG: RidA family protein [Acidimicrobiales bacterium]
MASHEPVIPPGSEKTYERFRFAPAVKVGGSATGTTIYVSGVIGSGADGSVPENAADEFTNAFSQLAATLEAAGASVSDIVELTSFHVNMGETLGAFMSAKNAAVAEPYPAWTAIGCTELAIPGARAEVKATAVIA